MPNTLTIVFTSAPSTEPVEFQTPNNPGVYVTGTQQANGTWQVVFTGVTKGTYAGLTGRLKNYPAVTATIAASGPVLNIQQTAPAGTSATGSGATSINVTANSSINATAYRFLSASAQAGPYAVLVTQAGATYNHTGLTAGVTVWYEAQYVGGGFYDDSPVSLAFSGTAAAAALTTYPRLVAGSLVSGDSMSTDLGGVTNWVKQYATAFGLPITTFANTTDFTTTNNGNVWVAANLNNLASSGSASRKQAGLLLAVSPHPAVAPWAGMVGLNNLRLAQAASPLKRYETINAAHRAMLAAQFAKTVVLPFGGNGTAGYTTNFTASRAASLTASFATVAQIQDWGSRTVYFRSTAADAGANSFYQPSIVAGETVTFNITGDALAIGTWGCDGPTLTLSRFEVRVDGVLKTTYNPVGRCEVSSIPSNNDGHTQDGLINDAIFLLGLGNTAHTVVLTFLDAGVAGAWDYAAILKTPAEANGAAAFVLDVPLLSTTAGIGYTYPGFPTWRQNLIDAVTSRTTNLKSVLPGYPIAFVDIGNRYQPETVPGDVQQVDGIHETTQGHGKIELRANDYMSGTTAGAAATPAVPAGGLNDTPTGSTGHYLTVSEAYVATSLSNAQQVAGIITATNTAGQVAGNYAHYGGFTKKLLGGQNGWIGCEFQADTINGILGFSTQNAAADISTNNASFYVDGGTGHLQARNNSTNIDTGYSPVAGDKIRLYVVGVSGQVQLQILNAGGAWRSPSAGGAAFVMSLVAAGDLFAHFQVDGLTGKIDYAQSGGLIAA